jgi:hypothetical protein
MHEEAAYPQFYPDPDYVWVTHWHGTSNPGRVFSSLADTIQSDPDKLIAPVLFVDGHSQQCDFTAVIKKNPMRGLDPTKDWMWYKPLK